MPERPIHAREGAHETKQPKDPQDPETASGRHEGDEVDPVSAEIAARSRVAANRLENSARKMIVRTSTAVSRPGAIGCRLGSSRAKPTAT
jgi:hypothetical protein